MSSMYGPSAVSSPRSRLMRAALAAGFVGLQAPTQVAPPGFTQLSWYTSPLHGALSFDLLPGGDFAVADSTSLFRLDRRGNRTPLASLPPGSSTAFARVTPDRTAVIVADSVVGTILRHDLATGQTRQLTTIRFCFDLAFDVFGRAYLSANPGFGTVNHGNRIYLLDLMAGATLEIARLTGPSGPLAVAADGTLFYALQPDVYPAPPGSVTLLRFSAARVQAAIAGQMMTPADATVHLAGLDAAYGLVFDERENLFVSDPLNGGVIRCSGAAQAQPFLPRDGSTFHLTLRFLHQGPGSFAPWQPDSSASLFCVATDWRLAQQILEVTTLRPTALHLPADPVPDGPFTLFMHGGPPLAPAVFALSRAALNGERWLPMAGGDPLWFGIDPAGLFHAQVVSIDTTGTAQVPLVNPAAVAGQFQAQAFFFTTSGNFGGSAAMDTVTLH